MDLIKKIADLNYDNRFNFDKYRYDKHILSFASKFDYLEELHNELEKINNVKLLEKMQNKRN